MMGDKKPAPGNPLSQRPVSLELTHRDISIPNVWGQISAILAVKQNTPPVLSFDLICSYINSVVTPSAINVSTIS